MSAGWRDWVQRFDARPARERLLMLAAAAALLLLAADQLWLSPAWRDWQAQRLLQRQAAQGLADMRQALAQRQAQAREQGQALLRELAAERERLQRTEAALAQRGSQLVHASEMVGLLEAVLKQQPGLRLRSLQNQARSELPGGPAGAPPLYRHGVELVVEGGYAELMAYCQALEALPQKLLWAGLQLDAEQHPRLQLTLRLYTLSQDREWLEI